LTALDETALQAYRQHTFHLPPSRPLAGPGQAVRFVNRLGLAFFWPIDGVDLPSLWQAVAGDRPVPSNHDDPAHVTWRWKDGLLDQKRWYYGKLLRRRATLVSLALLPCFYALAPRVYEVDDFRLAYEDGRLSWEAKSIAEALLKRGALDTPELRKKASMAGSGSQGRFERGLLELQAGLWILPVGVADAGAWHYAFIYELLDRWLPDVGRQAAQLTLAEARCNLTKAYLEAVGAASPEMIKRLFGWRRPLVEQSLGALEAQGEAVRCEDGRWAAVCILAGRRSSG
jgi:hypothetical protein